MDSNPYTSRKLWFCIIGVALSTWLVVNKHISPADLVTLYQLFGGGYLGVNLGQKAVTILADALATKNKAN